MARSVQGGLVGLNALVSAEEGRIDLDAPLKRYLPRFKLADAESTSSVTPRALLSHGLGLRCTPITFGEAFSGQMSEERYYRSLENVHSRGRFGYSNLHFTLAGSAIESVTGLTWQQFVTQRIFKPTGMNRSYCYADEMYALEDVALPTIEVDGEWKISKSRKTNATMHAAGGIGCSITDLATWVRLNLNGGEVNGQRLLSKQRTNEMQREHVQVGSRFYEFKRKANGLGWYVGSYQDETLIHHFGGFASARAHVSFMPQHDIGVVVVTNQGGAAANIVDMVACDVYDALLGLTHKRDLLVSLKKRANQQRKREMKNVASAPTIPVDSSNLSLQPNAYVGTYINDEWGTVSVSLDGTRLHASIGNINLDLSSSSTDQFMATRLPGQSLVDGKFVIEDTTHVLAVELVIPVGPARFARK